MYTVLCIILLLFSVNGNEEKNETSRQLLQHYTDNINKRLEFIDFCKSANLDILPYSDSKMNTITVSFKLDDSVFIDCFENFYIFLESQRGEVKKKKVWNTFNEEDAISYVFENVTCGIYNVVIQPCYNNWHCALFVVRYEELINMTSNDCIDMNSFPKSLSRNLKPAVNIEKEMVIILAVASLLIIIAVSGLVYYQRRSDRSIFKEEKRIPSRNRFEEHGCADREERNDKIVTKNIHVYILHYYDKNDVMKRKVEIMKDFLLKSSYFSSVKGIEDELSVILFDVDDWLNNMLEKNSNDGSIKKIILIDSEDCEDEEYEMENLIFTEFIKKLSNNLSRCLTDYDNLFVAQLDGIITSSGRIKNIVRRDRYRIPQHLIDLCFNLCSISELDVSNAQKNLRKLLLQHPIRYLNSLQHV